MARATAELDADAAGIARAAALLQAGGTVAFPTETVYGLGADASNPDAVAAIFAAKGRPSTNPLIVHLTDATAAEALAEWPATAATLAARFWPGPLTLVLPRRAHAALAPAISAGRPSLALRVPSAPVALALLAAVGRPLAAPSANRSGRISPTTAAHVRAGLDGRIDAVVDGGPCAVGLESTIVDLTGPPRLLRPGGVAAEALEAALGGPLLPPPTPVGGGGAQPSPGLFASHYAPRARLRLNATAARPGEVLLGFGPVAGVMSLSATGDLAEAAGRLFAELHALDDGRAKVIAVAPIPEVGLGRAINDRLRRAAAPRPGDEDL